MSDVEDYAAKQAAEYGQFVANQPIDYDGARAYNTGDPVPASNVEAHGYLDAGVVDKVATAPQAKKAAESAAATTAPASTTASPKG